MKENEVKFEEIKNNFKKYFSELQIKFESLQKQLDEKYKYQLKEIESIKNRNNELIIDINDVNFYLEKIKSSKNNNIINNKIKEINNSRNHVKNENHNNIQPDDNNNAILFNKNETLQTYINLGNFDYQTIPTSNKKSNIIQKGLINNNNFNNINILDDYKNKDDQYKIEFSPNKNLSKYKVLDRSKSPDTFSDNKNLNIRNKNKDLSSAHHKIENKEEKNEFDSYFNSINKKSRKKIIQYQILQI